MRPATKIGNVSDIFSRACRFARTHEYAIFSIFHGFTGLFEPLTIVTNMLIIEIYKQFF